MDKTYATPAAFDRALKKAAKTAGNNLGEAYRQALRDRFLCRVFHDGNEGFVLKGAGGMLARVPNARATRDLDFAVAGHAGIDQVLAEMERIASIDLNDWCSFRLTKSEESMDENGYSRLLKLRFASFVGMEEKDPILIDLSLDCVMTRPPERITPANRIDVEGLETCDYLIYPLADQLADKFCAIMEVQPGGHPSSRMKDLVDVVTYATSECFELSQLRHAITSECVKRGMTMPKRFDAPESWRERFAGFATKNRVVEEFASFDEASNLASKLFDAALSDESEDDLVWNPGDLCWSVRPV
ncbi:MAG: hypothetical protein DBY20_01480 [Coriobacteriia bacterium]|nr:MAG: hypothetical protein DBY20_01480 [Coriobacteriia bacterium]